MERSTRMLQRAPGRSTAWWEVAHWTSRPRPRKKAGQSSCARSGRGHDTTRCGQLQIPDDTLGEGLAHERWRVEDEGTICGTRTQVGRAQRGLVLSWCNTLSWACDRLHSCVVGLGLIRGRCRGRVSSGSCATKSEHLERLTRAGRDTNVVGRTLAKQSWVEHLAGILVDKLDFERSNSAPQFYWNNSRQVALELHMDDIHGGVDDTNSSKIFRAKLSSKGVTGASGENRMGTSRD